MTDPDTDFSDIEALWHQQSDTIPVIPVSRLRRSILRARLMLALEMLVSAGGVIAGVWLMITNAPVSGLAAVIYAAGCGGLSLWSRLRHVGMGDEALMPHIDNAVKEARGRLRGAQAGMGVCCAALIFVAVMAFVTVLTGRETGRGLVGMALVCALMPFFMLGSIRTMLRAKQELSALQMMRGEHAGQSRAGID